MGKLSRLIACLLVFSFTILLPLLPSRAEVVFNVVAPFDAILEINCDGNVVDVVDLSGEIHILTAVTANNNTISVKTQYVPRNVSGTGMISGATYRAVGVTTDKFNAVFDGPSSETFVNNFYIIGQDGGTRFLVHETLHMTVDAGGNLVVFHDNASVTCPGTLK